MLDPHCARVHYLFARVDQLIGLVGIEQTLKLVNQLAMVIEASGELPVFTHYGNMLERGDGAAFCLHTPNITLAQMPDFIRKANRAQFSNRQVVSRLSLLYQGL